MTLMSAMMASQARNQRILAVLVHSRRDAIPGNTSASGNSLLC